MKRTDLAIEFSNAKDRVDIDDVVTRTVVDVDREFEKQTGKARGRYITIESNVVRKGNRGAFSRVAEELGGAIRALTTCSNCLVVGLGNPDMTADSLGKRVLDRILITRHLGQKGVAVIGGICPNVLGVTGIESYDIVKGTVLRTKPDCVLAVDSLAGATVGRLASAFQVSNAGITPGSGVSNHRARLDQKSLGCTVLSLGVPLVVYASTMIEDALGEHHAPYDSEIGSLIVTPKDIDLYVSDCANIIAQAINIAFFGKEMNDMLV